VNSICTYDIQSTIAIAKAALNDKKAVFTGRLDLNFKKKLVKCDVWKIALCGAESWALRKVSKWVAGEGWRRSV